MPRLNAAGNNPPQPAAASAQDSVQTSADVLFEESLRKARVDIDRLFALLMVINWVGGIILALVVSPRTWIGDSSGVHVHVWAAAILGAGISAFVGSSRVDLQACKLEYSIVSPK